MVTGDNNSAEHSADWVTIGYSLETGEALWTDRLDGGTGDTDVPRTVVVSPDGGSVVITGNSWGEGTGSDYLTAVYDTATGEKRWSTRHDGSAHGLDVAYTAAFTPSGDHVVVTGQSNYQLDEMTSDADMATISYLVRWS